MPAPDHPIWITGARGLIGHYLVQLAPTLMPGRRIRPWAREDLDLLDHDAVRREFAKDRPAAIIHCAAVTVVAEAQKNPALAQQVNVEVTRCLADIATDIPLVFFSTDLVFDGRKGDYIETDPVNPLHVYSETKVEGERIVLANPRHLVVRTSINAGKSLTGNRAFNEQLRKTLQGAGAAMKLFTDEFRCPIPAVETARAVWELLAKNCAGIYHVAGTEKLSRHRIGQLLVQQWPEIRVSLAAGSARDFPGPPRALDTSLNVAKVQAVLARPLPGLGEWLEGNPGALG